MKAEILCVGTEILLGNILNTNTVYLARRCADAGLSVFYQGVVGDNEDRLEEAIKEALGRSDVLILSGGLGPTSDDLTKETAAKALGLEMAFDRESYDNMAQRLKAFGHKTINETNNKQAYIPVGASALRNHNGTAPGILIETDKTTAKEKYPHKIIALLPGPPRELEPMFEEYLFPFFKSLSEETIHSIMVKMIGIGESDAASRVAELILNSENPTVAPYAKLNEVHFRITAKAADEKKAEEMIAPVYKKVKEKLGEYIYTTDENETLEEVLVKKAIEKGLKITTAESLTGGLLAARLVNVSGASEVFRQGFVTYSNEAKIKTLSVSEETVNGHGAVSSKCAEEMARGVAEKTGADISISTTGIAGPSGGTKEAPVGRVYIGIYNRGEVKSHEFTFLGERQTIRELTVINALRLLREVL